MLKKLAYALAGVALLASVQTATALPCLEGIRPVCGAPYIVIHLGGGWYAIM